MTAADHTVDRAPWGAAVASLLEPGGPVVVAGHVGPDGDALGAMLALRQHLVHAGVDVHVTIGETPLRVPAQLAGLPGVEHLERPDQVPDAPALLVVVDLNSRDRLGSVAPLVDRAGRVLVIDHHQAGDPTLGDVRLVDPSASSTVALVEQLLRQAGGELDADVAACLYAGLVTDTGRFQHDRTTAADHALAGRLLDAGIDHAALSRRLFEQRSFGYLKLLGRVLERATFEPSHRLVHAWLTDTDLAWAGCAATETDPLTDVLTAADPADVTLLAKHIDGEWRVSLRSDGGVDVAALARELDGGGHVRAAGFRHDPVPYDQLLARVLGLLDAMTARDEVA